MHSSPNICQVIKSRRMRWGEACSLYGERTGEERCTEDLVSKH